MIDVTRADICEIDHGEDNSALRAKSGRVDIVTNTYTS